MSSLSFVYGSYHNDILQVCLVYIKLRQAQLACLFCLSRSYLSDILNIYRFTEELLQVHIASLCFL